MKKSANERVIATLQVPWSTKLIHHLTLYNPILWWRVVVMKKKYVEWKTKDILLLCLSPLFGSASRMIRSMTMSSRVNGLIKTNNMQTTSFFVADYWMFVPYSYLIWKATTTTYHVISAIYEISKSRCVAHPAAYNCLLQRLQQKRAYRTYSYDLYLPISKNNGTAINPAEYILFLPGAYVEHVAYAEPASLLSDAGYIVVVMSGEPLGIVDTYLPRFFVSNIRYIQRTVENQFVSNKGNVHDMARWVLMGHSMGSLACTQLVSMLPKVKEIVMWGSVPFLDYMGNLSQADNIRVLVVQGTNDVVLEMFSTPETIQKFWDCLPKSTVKYEIVGGTHGGFGHYISNFVVNQDADSVLQVTEQHSLAVQATVDFLRVT
jgi:hypothetical protein